MQEPGCQHSRRLWALLLLHGLVLLRRLQPCGLLMPRRLWACGMLRVLAVPATLLRLLQASGLPVPGPLQTLTHMHHTACMTR